MIGFNTSPSITLFARENGVDRDSLVTLLKSSFGNHVAVLRASSIEYMSNGKLRIFENNNAVDFSIDVIPVPVNFDGYSKNIIGILKTVEPHDGCISVLSAPGL